MILQEGGPPDGFYTIFHFTTGITAERGSVYGLAELTRLEIGDRRISFFVRASWREVRVGLQHILTK